ncbi:hypothetical protein HOD05_02155 [Candidatus Woesearchaeota archaeon]|jgi:hypothetical protein|nr:hypothetical protein [Candidatus Woesearchaeota archaeon]MBT4151242.1 hypothetical protein [Candidatus Woesearchaeota archaeon]MBT4247285.1 hypothetical protein [Candidatus Woesearchaeota archaeon]MBT4433998.1 hypothetical protein [Candidatus Woesearchaeota archaeon]MBT7332395.1 hypothetical protein [Candidatus Woesearchaeota archaeon]
MGWLFGKKKVPKVPFPQGREANALKFPSSTPAQRIIEPRSVKEAVGVGKAPLPPSKPQREEETLVPSPKEVPNMPTPMQPHEIFGAEGPLYIKMEVYQTILGELDELKTDFTRLNKSHRILEESEFNEEHHYGKLKNNMKLIHDKLLQADKTLFKVQE